MKDKAGKPINKTNVLIQVPLEIDRRVHGAFNGPLMTPDASDNLVPIPTLFTVGSKTDLGSCRDIFFISH